MQKITVYKLSDGRLIETEALAIACQQEIDIKNSLTKLCNDHFKEAELSELPGIMYNKRKDFMEAFSNK